MNIQGYSELREHIRTRENCYPLIWWIIKDLYGEKTYRFLNLRKWQDFNKKQLILHQMCYLSPVWSMGRFMAFLWVVLREQTVSYRNNRYFFPYKPFYFECIATMPMLIFPTWATCVVTPSKQNVSTLFVYCCLLVSFISVHGVSSRYNST